MGRLLQLGFRTDDDHGWLEVSGEIDLATVPELRAALRNLPPVRVLVVDVGGVVFCSARGLRTLLETADELAAAGDGLVLTRCPASIERLMDLARVRRRVWPVLGDPVAVQITSGTMPDHDAGSTARLE